MPQESALVRWIDGLLELGWLFIVMAVPVFFNARDYRVFEPDKIVLMRNVVLVMVALFLVKIIYEAPYYLHKWTKPDEGRPPSSFWVGLREALKRRPVVIATLAFGVVYIIATFDSILPTISFWGSYDRMEGAYTYLTYIVLFLLVLSHMRSWRQFERIATAVILASVPVAAYSWLQHFNSDPLVWANASGAAERTPSTLGNPIFLGAYLLMAVPLTLHRLVLRAVALLRPPADAGFTPASEQYWLYLGFGGYAAALVLQLGGVLFSVSRGPALGLLAAMVVFILTIAIRRRIMWLLRIAAAFALLLVVVFGVENTVFKSYDTASTGFSRFLHILPSESGTSEVRSLLWESAPSVLKDHPVFGCGPEVLLFCWYPEYPTGLRSVELATAAPDRSHDEEIDVLLMSGVVGEIAYLAFLGATIMVLVRLVKRSTDLRSLTFATALLAAFLGHIVEGAFGIAFSATLVMFWVIAAAATSLDTGKSEEAAGSYPRLTGDAVTTTPAPAAGAQNVRANRPQGASSTSSSRRRREQRSSRSGPPSRRGMERIERYSAGAWLSRLGGGARSILAVGSVVAVLLIVLAGAQFVANIQLIQADADYRQALNYEQAAGSLGTSQIQDAEATYQAAIAEYQNAINTVPTWNDPPPQDTYDLFLGKTYLEYAVALHQDKSASTQQVQTALQQGLDVFEHAAKANPLNPDHPRNIGKLYIEWYQLLSPTQDVSKLLLADASYARAAALAPHNPDILDEWANLNRTIGDADPARTQTEYAQALAHLKKALQLYPASGPAFRDIGYVYAKYASTATAKHQPKQSLQYAKLERDAWLNALRYAAPQYQQIYPPLSYLYYATFKEYCTAAQYASYGIKAINDQSLPDSDGQLRSGFQYIVQQAASHGCHVTTP